MYTNWLCQKKTTWPNHNSWTSVFNICSIKTSSNQSHGCTIKVNIARSQEAKHERVKSTYWEWLQGRLICSVKSDITNKQTHAVRQLVLITTNTTSNSLWWCTQPHTQDHFRRRTGDKWTAVIIFYKLLLRKQTTYKHTCCMQVY